MSTPEWSYDDRWISYTQGTVDLRCPVTRLDRRENASDAVVISRPDGSRPVWIPVTDVRIGVQFSDLSWSTDGTRLVYWARYESSGQRGIWTVNSDGSDRRFIAATGRGWATWSPDGSAVALSAFSGNPPDEQGLWLVNPDGGGRRMLTDLAGSDLVSAPTWSPSGNEIAVAVAAGPPFGGRTYRILVIDATNARMRELAGQTYSTTSDPCRSGWDAWFHVGGWSNDGRRILYAIKEGGRSGVYVVDTVTGRVAPVASRIRWVSRIRIESTNAPSWLSICAPRHNVESDLCR